VDLPPGARVEVTRSATPVRLARLRQTPFSGRLVRKFELPIQGWRGPMPQAGAIHTGPIPIIRTPRPMPPLPSPHHSEPGDAPDPSTDPSTEK
jgi:NAD+ kinase